MLDKWARIRLVDFGIAKLFQTGQEGTMIGTEGYSPPEQYRGVADPREVTSMRWERQSITC